MTTPAGTSTRRGDVPDPTACPAAGPRPRWVTDRGLRDGGGCNRRCGQRPLDHRHGARRLPPDHRPPGRPPRPPRPGSLLPTVPGCCAALQVSRWTSSGWSAAAGRARCVSKTAAWCRWAPRRSPSQPSTRGTSRAMGQAADGDGTVHRRGRPLGGGGPPAHGHRAVPATSAPRRRHPDGPEHHRDASPTRGPHRPRPRPAGAPAGVAAEGDPPVEAGGDRPLPGRPPTAPAPTSGAPRSPRWASTSPSDWTPHCCPFTLVVVGLALLLLLVTVRSWTTPSRPPPARSRSERPSVPPWRSSGGAGRPASLPCPAAARSPVASRSSSWRCCSVRRWTTGCSWCPPSASSAPGPGRR